MPELAAITPDWEALVSCIRREGTPKRVHYIELFLDREVQDEVCRVYRLLDDLDQDDDAFEYRRQVRIQRFLGYDYVRCGMEGLNMPFRGAIIDDTADLQRANGRAYMDEHRGPITTWDEFHAYPWPDVDDATTQGLEWYEENLPDDMCVIASGGFAHFCEHLTWLFGYESLCYALFDQRDLVKAIADKLYVMFEKALERMLQFSRVQVVWGSDDMGFRSGTLIRPDDLRTFVFPGHRRMAEMSHASGKPYLLHACGNLAEVMDDLIDDVGIDAKHSFEDTIEDVRDLKVNGYGQRTALLGGIDVDFMCRASEDQIRERVRETLDVCMPGGGYCLGSGNSVANYIPFRHYMAMMEEGRNWRP